MTNNWTRNQWLLLVSLIVIVGILGAILYTLWIVPLNENREALESQIESKEDTIRVLQNETDSSAVSESESRRLQETLPVKEQEDQFLIMLERAEAASRTSIQSISNVGTQTPVQTAEAPGEEKLTYELEMISGSFGDLMQFLFNLEEMERYSLVESISFDSSTIEQGDEEALYYFVTVSTYYYPSLELLESEAPQYDFGTPGNKQSPFQTD
ncbi:type 4a pilus biogenesis protein PilO [Salimicrobium flavidum]|uniref:Pilus assembly protein, PilO n=1 Tax=Salimicrobium flavidum TaxID=570947 RepID=A0A1N7JMX6_9BACI|nr:type 4a pilus biogenesis protein PilO [Salimicrobium flavidum]SIS50594.1 Pilus assembly protein, PilO [Salimicrobium flavidum]